MTACDILTKVNGQTVDTYNWSGDLATYQTATIDLGTISGIPDNADVSFEINYTGDMDESNNVLSNEIEFRTTLEISYEMQNKNRIGLSFSHISNANLGNKNPGVEIISLSYQIPY